MILHTRLEQWVNIKLILCWWPPPAFINTIHYFYSTSEHCCSTSSLKLRNPSWILESFNGNDRKCVKGCFFRKPSMRTSIRVTADETAALWEPVTTVRKRKKVMGGGNNSLTVVWSVLPILTNLSFHSWFGDVDGRLCVKLQASARLSLFPNDVSKQSMRLRNKTSCAFLKFTVVQNKHNCCWLTCREHLGHRWHSGIPYQSARWRWCHRLHLLRGLHSLDMKEKKTARRWFISFFLCVCFCVCCDLKQIHKQDWSYLVVPCKTNLLLLPPLHNVLP